MNVIAPAPQPPAATEQMEADEQAIRAEALKIKEDEGLTHPQIAKLVGLPVGTLSNWLGGTYGGNGEKITSQVRVWLTSREARAQVAPLNIKSPAFLLTSVSKEVMDACLYAQVVGEFTVIIGSPGVGKTKGLEEHRRGSSNVWLVTAEPAIKTASALLQDICIEMGIVERSATRVPRAIGRFVDGKGGLLIIDEAQFVTTEALEQLRCLNDRYGLAIIICGNESIVSRLEGVSNSNSQLYSRAGTRVRIPGGRVADADIIIDAWGVSDEKESAFLRALAKKPGAIRNIDKVMKRANVLAAGAGQDRTVEHLRAAWMNLAPDGSVRAG